MIKYNAMNLIRYAIFTVVILFVFNNLFKFNSIYNYGIVQYIYNIKNFHKDIYVKSKTTLKVYSDSTPLHKIDKTKNKYMIRKGDIFKIKGIINQEYLNWVAVSFFYKEVKIRGYVLIDAQAMNSGFDELKRSILGGDYKNRFFSLLSISQMEKQEKKQCDIYVNKVIKKMKITKAKNISSKQQFSENENFKFLLSKKNVDYYYDKSDEAKVDSIYNMYCGYNFETILLNSYTKYKPEIDGTYNQSGIDKIINSFYFNAVIVSILIFIIILKAYFTPSFVKKNNPYYSKKKTSDTNINDGKKKYGDMYEKKVGSHYEAKGYKVTYRGLELKEKDGGIDLIAVKNNEMLLIQCKYWVELNVIDYKMVKEFYGSCNFYIDQEKLNNNSSIHNKEIVCIYAIPSKKSLNINAEKLFQINYTKCKYQIIELYKKNNGSKSQYKY